MFSEKMRLKQENFGRIYWGIWTEMVIFVHIPIPWHSVMPIGAGTHVTNTKQYYCHKWRYAFFPEGKTRDIGRKIFMKKKKKLLVFSILVIFLISQNGCALIFNGTSQEVPIMSTPGEASILLDGQEIGTTPMTVVVPRSGSHIISIKKTGYTTRDVAFRKNTTPMFWIGLFVLTFPFELLSLIGGSLNDLYPEAINVRLEKNKDLSE